MKLFELQSSQELVELNKQLNILFQPLALTVNLTHHFVERLFGREKTVTVDEIISAFQMLASKYRKRILKAKFENDYEGVIRDFEHDLVIIFGIDKTKLNAISIKHVNPNQFGMDTHGGDRLDVGV